MLTVNELPNDCRLEKLYITKHSQKGPPLREQPILTGYVPVNKMSAVSAGEKSTLVLEKKQHTKKRRVNAVRYRCAEKS